MFVRLKPGRSVFREGHLRESADSGINPIFRLFETPPPRDIPSREPYEGERPEDVPTSFEKWLSDALEEVTDEDDIKAFMRSEQDQDYEETSLARDYHKTLGRAAAITRAATELDHGNDAHWTADGYPNPEAVEGISGEVKVQPGEIAATVPTLRRDPRLAALAKARAAKAAQKAAAEAEAQGEQE